MIEVSHLHYIIATAELGSFSQAALALRIKQSTLSQRMRYLETDLGITLFDRSPRGAQLTRAGSHVLADARRIIADIEQIRRQADAYRSGKLGAVSIGMSAAIPSQHMQALVLELSRTCPDIALTTVSAGRPALLEGLQRGDLDMLLLAGTAGPSGTAYRLLGSDRLVAVIERTHSLARHAALYWSDLRDLTILLTDTHGSDELLQIFADHFPRGERDMMFARHALGPSALCHLIDRYSAMITPDRMVAGLPEHLVAIPLCDFHGPSRLDHGLCWLPRRASTALIRILDIIGPTDPVDISQRPDPSS